MNTKIVAMVIGFASLLPAYWLALRTPAVGLYHDDGVYLCTAKALATGHGYRIISLPSEIPQTKYPFLFPAVLAAVWKLSPNFPENVFILKLVPFVFAVVWLGLSYRLLCSEGMGRPAAMITILLTAASPTVMYFSSALLSETMFAALCAAALLILRRLERGEGGAGTACAAGILTGLATLTRTAGLPLALAGGITLLWRRGAKVAARYTLVFTILYLPWLAWVVSHQIPQSTDAYYSAQNYGGWNVLFNFTWDQKAAIVGWNLLLLAAAPLMQVGAAPSAAVIGSIAALYGYLRYVRGALTVLHIFLVLYFVMLMCWAWPPARFVTVVLPLILYFVWQSFAVLIQRPKPVVAGALILFVVCWLADYDAALKTRETGIILPIPVKEENWHEAERLFVWIRNHTKSDAVLLGNVDPTFYLFTGRKSVRGFYADSYRLYYSRADSPLATVDNFRDAIVQQNVTYIIMTPNEGFAEGQHFHRLISALRGACPRAVSLVYQGRSGGYSVFQVTPDLLRTLAASLTMMPGRPAFHRAGSGTGPIQPQAISPYY